MPYYYLLPTIMGNSWHRRSVVPSFWSLWWYERESSYCTVKNNFRGCPRNFTRCRFTRTWRFTSLRVVHSGYPAPASRPRHLIQETGLVCITVRDQWKGTMGECSAPTSFIDGYIGYYFIDGRYSPLMLHHGIPGVDGNEYIGRLASYARRMRRRRWLDLSMAFFKQRYSFQFIWSGHPSFVGLIGIFIFVPSSASYTVALLFPSRLSLAHTYSQCLLSSKSASRHPYSNAASVKFG